MSCVCVCVFITGEGGSQNKEDEFRYMCLFIWCLLFVLIRQGLRGGSGPQRLTRSLGIETGNPIMTFQQRSSFLPSTEREPHRCPLCPSSSVALHLASGLFPLSRKYSRRRTGRKRGGGLMFWGRDQSRGCRLNQTRPLNQRHLCSEEVNVGTIRNVRWESPPRGKKSKKVKSSVGNHSKKTEKSSERVSPKRSCA